MNPFEEDHPQPSHSGDPSPDDVLFAVDEEIAYPYADEGSDFEDSETIKPVSLGGVNPGAGGGPSYDPSAAFEDDDVGGESLLGDPGRTMPPARPAPAAASAPADADRGADEPQVSRSEPGHIPGRTRVSYSQGRPKTISSAQFIGVKPRAPSSAALWVPFLLIFAGLAGATYFTLLAGSPVLGGVSFVAGATMAMFCRILLRR